MLADKEALFDEVQALYEAANKKCFIEPTKLCKYKGTIYAVNNGRFEAHIRHSSLKKSILKRFDTYADAFEFIKTKNREHKLPIRNRIRNYGIYMKVKTTQGQKMIFDHRNLELVQKYNIFSCFTPSTQSYYSVIRTPVHESGPRLQRMHNIFMCHTPSGDKSEMSMDHINRRSHDNREFNLRLASGSTQTINTHIRSDNITGVVGVHYHTKHKCFVAHYTADGKYHTKDFSVKRYGYDQARQMAIDYRKLKEATIPVYIDAYRRNVAKSDIVMDEDDVYDTTDDLEYDFSSISS